MKKLLVISVAVLFAAMLAVPAYAVSIKQITNNFATGTSADHEEAIAMVYNNTDVALAKGDVLVYDGTNDDGRSVTKCNGLGQIVAGVANEAIAASSWGKMLVYGYHSAVKYQGAAGYDVTIGYGLYPYGTGIGSNETVSTYDGYAGGGYLVGTAKMVKPFATALDAATGGTSTTVEAFVNCL